ncbi:MAG: dihydroorotase [Faecalibacterium sp.]
MYLKNAKIATGDTMEFLLRDGKIFALGTDLSAAALPEEETLDAAGKTILPAFIDLHCHWRTPGFEYKEDLATGSAAAAAGGYTYVNLMPNTKPVCSGAAQALEIQMKVEEIGLCSANQTVSITQNFDGTTLDHLKSLPSGVKFITEDGHGIQSADVMARAFAIAQQKGITIMSHAEVSDISPWDYRLAEDLETVRNLYLAEYYGTALHMCHVSTRGAIEAITAAKWRGVPVTCEASPHHLCFNTEDLDTRVNPPIRTADDCEALLDGIRSGAVDAIATDHAPHSEEDKLAGSPGMVGLETAFGLCYTKLCKNDGISLAQLSTLMSTNPAAILGLNKGALAPGFDADVVLVDLDTPYVVDKNALHSKSKNCPFDGIALFGKACTTIKGGKVTYQA